jgi:hypothetical protein
LLILLSGGREVPRTAGAMPFSTIMQWTRAAVPDQAESIDISRLPAIAFRSSALCRYSCRTSSRRHNAVPGVITAAEPAATAK